MKKMKQAVMLAASAAMLCATSLATAHTASASTYAASCNKTVWDDCMTFYYNSNLGGSHTSFWDQDDDFADNTFLSSGTGQGQVLKNNAASASFWTQPLGGGSEYGLVYYNSGEKGPCDAIKDGWYTNQLHNTYNENASWSPSGNSNVWSTCYVWS